MTIAVEDSARPAAATKATAGDMPASTAAPISSAPHAITCAAPRPKMSRLRLHSRDGFSSSPMTKSSSTTPNSATPRTESGSRNSFSPNGPMAMPATR